MHTLQLELADSELSGIDLQDTNGRQLCLRLAAAALRRSDEDGRGIAGHGRGVLLELHGVEPAGELPDGCFGRIVQGRVRRLRHLGLGGADGPWLAALPLPGELAGALELELTFGHRTQLTLHAQCLTCRFEGEPNFRESLAC